MSPPEEPFSGALGLSKDYPYFRLSGFFLSIIAIFAFFNQSWDTLLPVFGSAIAVAAADTFASEFGCVDPRVRMITRMKKCEPGLNG